MLPIYLASIETEQERAFFIELYNENRRAMYAFAFRYLKSEHDAEDVVHDVFLTVANGYIDKLSSQPKECVRSFLFVCTKNRALSLIKKRSGSVSLECIAENGHEVPSTDSDVSIEDIISDKALLEKAKEAMNGLDPIYADALFLHLEGYSARSISELFGENYQTVKKRIYRAKLLLREAVLGKGGAK